ncbi:MAG: lipid IV(A) 4-amino-4-deoxy-L-arabinosyltransferase, partial [Hafniaceae bacterium]|nr:lipid IV(A) 4-amino-4-deoxy-L-arabinosyltransferase [Hafniaceae bacterium]
MRVIKTLSGLLFALLYLLPLNWRPLWQPDETRYAEISREMLARGDWTVPHLLGLRYFEKPVAGYWINNISQWLFGDNNFAVRFGSVFCTALSTLLVYWLAMLIWKNSRTAILAAVIYFSMFLVYAVGTYSVLDPMITLWMSAAMVSFYLTLKATTPKAKIGAYALLGIACGMGFMTKGFLALALPVISVLPIVIQHKRVKELFLFGPIAVVVAAILSAPWAWSIYLREPDFWNYFFWVEHIQRFAESDAQHKAPFWYYLPVLVAGVMPWLALLPGAIRHGWRGFHPDRFFLLSWLVMPFLFFSIAKGKLPTYILPCMAPLALLMAHYASELVAKGQWRTFKVNAVINILFGVVGAIAVSVMALGHFESPLYGTGEQGELSTILIGVVCFAGWSLFGVIALVRGGKNWLWSAVCPLVLGLLIAQAIPQKIENSKNPQAFIDDMMPQLASSRYVLSDEVGIAAGLAWELKRSDILMFDYSGEL